MIAKQKAMMLGNHMTSCCLVCAIGLECFYGPRDDLSRRLIAKRVVTP